MTNIEIADLQTKAMRSIVENMRASLATYLDAVAQSPDLRARLAADPALELGGVFNLIAHRALALVTSAEKSVDGPETEKKEPS
jgi:hypothetical protein